jgi:signal transduction histidine kinase
MLGTAMVASSLDPPQPSEVQIQHLEWLTRLRAIAVVVTFGAVALAHGLGALADAGLAFAASVAFLLHDLYARQRVGKRRGELASSPRRDLLEREVFAQLVGDLVVLTALLHFSGGAQNPFAVCYTFHMAISAMLLPGRSAVIIALAGGAAYGCMVFGELLGLLPHHAIRMPQAAGSPWREPLFVLWHFLSTLVMMFGTLYFVHALATRYRRAEALRREHDRVAQSRERFVHIGEVAAGVAHSVRNPLHGLLNAVELLSAHANDDPRRRETLSLMGEALQRIDRVTQRLLVLSRDAPLARGSTDVDALVRDAIRLVSPRARGSQARLELAPGGAGIVEVDAGRIGEALVNVVDNALDACRAGGDVTVRTASDADGGVHISVDDTGPGIAPEDLERVFDPFFTTKPIGEGSGLGLAITRRIVEEHGGRVSVDKGPGGGTRVVLHLPRRAPEGGGA